MFSAVALIAVGAKSGAHHRKFRESPNPTKKESSVGGVTIIPPHYRNRPAPVSPKSFTVRLAAAITFALVMPCGELDCLAAQASISPLPQRLSETGLFVEGSTTEIRPGLLAFSPQYPLWSDGAIKRRWIYLPPGSFIDASQPNAWEFPRGTRLWKEFSLGRRVETRFIERLSDGSWRFAAYEWNEAGSEAVLASSEVGASVQLSHTPERRYAIPSESDCRACHEGAAVPVLGFSALQLSPDRDLLAPHAEPRVAGQADLRALVAQGWLRNLPQKILENPPRIAAASPAERAALGYMHGNCGHCHGKPGDSGASVPVGVLLAQDVTDPESADKVLRTLIGASSRFRLSSADDAKQIVAPGESHMSMLPLRMRSRDTRVQMPPLGTQISDTEALALIERWIDHDLQPARNSQP